MFHSNNSSSSHKRGGRSSIDFQSSRVSNHETPPTTQNNYSNNSRIKNRPLFGTPIFEGDEENERELKARGQERYTSEHQQYATDEKGRRRFHGAFTGGFSAGYFNTVGSKEGWKPSNDYRTESRITDFMDEDDVRDIFGVSGSKQVQATDRFKKVSTTKTIADPLADLFGGQMNSSDQKHLELLFGSSEKLISLNESVPNETNIGYSLLRKMGWVPSRGIGVKSYTKKDTVELHADTKMSTIKIKEDKCGIGYKISNLNEILNIQPVIPKKNNLEEDYYQVDDMSNYDLDLRTTQEKEEDNVWDEKLLFIKSKQPFVTQTKFLAPKVPESFVPNHVFDTTLIKKEYKKLDHRIQLHLMAAEERRKTLFESTKKGILQNQNAKDSEKTREIKEQLSKAMSNRFVSTLSTDILTNRTVNETALKGTRVISDWQPDPLISKRFGCQPIIVQNKIRDEIGPKKPSSILDKTFLPERSSQEENTIKTNEKIEGGNRPSIDLFKQIFETKKLNLEHEDEITPSNRVSTNQQIVSSKDQQYEMLAFDSVNSLKEIVKEIKDSKEGTNTLLEKRKAVLESMKSKSIPKERVDNSSNSNEGKREKKESKKEKLDFNVYPIKKDSTSSYIAQLESRISDIRKLLDSSDEETKKRKKKHKKEKKEKKKKKHNE